MFGRKKTNGEETLAGVEMKALDLFETEEKLSHELQAARKQLAETTAKLAALDVEYRQAAWAALGAGNDDAALNLRREIERLGVRKDGLDAQIADLAAKSEEAGRLAQAERVAQAEKARRDRFQKLIEQGKAAGEVLRTAFEQFMHTLSDYDNAREALAAPEFGVEGYHEVEALHNATFVAHPTGLLQGPLLDSGWRPRINTKVRPTSLQITSLVAPPK